MGPLPAQPYSDSGPPEAHRRRHIPYLPSPSVPRESRLPEAIRVLLPILGIRSRRSGAIGLVERRSLPQFSIRHVLQFLRRDEDLLPERAEVDRQSRGETAYRVSEGDQNGGEIERRRGNDEGDGADAVDEVGGVRSVQNGATSTVTVRESEEGFGDRKPREEFQSERGRDVVWVSAICDKGS